MGFADYFSYNLLLPFSSHSSNQNPYRSSPIPSTDTLIDLPAFGLRDSSYTALPTVLVGNLIATLSHETDGFL